MNWLKKLLGGEEAGPPWHPPLAAERDSFLPSGDHAAAFRACVTVAGDQPNGGKRIFRSGGATSTVSQLEADRQARGSAEENLATALANAESPRDQYAYSLNRRLEPVLEDLALPGKPPVAQVTVNGYGALVVNASNVLFADVDTRADDTSSEDQPANEQAAARLRAVIERQPDLGFRVYRTRNGWRYLCTSHLFDPVGGETRQLLEQLGADAKYVLLCRVQKCFRARLTPKPWRIGESSYKPDGTFGVTKRQVEYYLKKAAPFATAAFTAEVGRRDGPLSPEVQLIIAHHDTWCAVTSGRTLA